jgi:CheY-like chemotaxis protein/two-component sensor histidine kinase
MLAHELRNPLATIRAGLQVQRLASTDAQAAKSVTELMERQVGHLVGLVDDLLDVSRINQGKIQLRRGPVELATVVHAAVETARSLIERMGHEFILAVPPEPIWLNADPVRLAQVVGNLLSNAAKFTEHGGCISLNVALRGEEAEIRVRDNGGGIAADQLPFVFDLFMQGEPSIERSNSGLGIGLALVKTLVDMHGGTVAAHSAGVGQGSEFVVRLPVTHEASQPITPPHEPLVTPTARRVLVVDDNRDAAESLAMLLKLSGHEVYIAHDGLEAVEQAAQVSPDLILLDIGLPKINGLEAARRIREQSQGRRPVLVALTGWGQDTDRQKSREAGFNAHIVKPVLPDVLANLLVEFPVVSSIS